MFNQTYIQLISKPIAEYETFSLAKFIFSISTALDMPGDGLEAGCVASRGGTKPIVVF